MGSLTAHEYLAQMSAHEANLGVFLLSKGACKALMAGRTDECGKGIEDRARHLNRDSPTGINMRNERECFC